MYFNGSNKEGYYFVGATARRHEKLTQTLLYFRVKQIYDLSKIYISHVYSCSLIEN